MRTSLPPASPCSRHGVSALPVHARHVPHYDWRLPGGPNRQVPAGGPRCRTEGHLHTALALCSTCLRLTRLPPADHTSAVRHQLALVLLSCQVPGSTCIAPSWPLSCRPRQSSTALAGASTEGPTWRFAPGGKLSLARSAGWQCVPLIRWQAGMPSFGWLCFPSVGRKGHPVGCKATITRNAPLGSCCPRLPLGGLYRKFRCGHSDFKTKMK